MSMSSMPTWERFNLFFQHLLIWKSKARNLMMLNCVVLHFSLHRFSVLCMEFHSSADMNISRETLCFTHICTLHSLERLNAFDSNEFSLQHLTTLQKLTRLELLHLKPPACQRLVELTSLTGQLEMLSLQGTTYLFSLLLPYWHVELFVLCCFVFGGCDVQSDGQDLHFLTALTKLRVLDISGTKTLRTTIEPFLKNITVIDEIKDFSHENEKENNKSDVSYLIDF